jgi:hypothetical protein
MDCMGVEVDELATLIAANEAHTLPSSSPSIQKAAVVQADAVPVSSKKSESRKQKKKGKKKPLRLFGRKVKKEKPPRWEVIPVPNLVETKSVAGEVSLLESVPGTAPKEAVVVAANKPPMPKKERRRSFNVFAKKRKSIKQQQQTIQEEPQQQPPVPHVYGPPIVTPPVSPVSLLVASKPQDEVSSIAVPASDMPPSEISSITYSKQQKDDEPAKQLQPPEAAPHRVANDDDSVEDVAAGISRKWALFFHKEKGEAVELSSDDDSSQGDLEENFFPRAVPASDMPPEILRLSTSSVNDGVSAITSEVQSSTGGLASTSERDLVDTSAADSSNNYFTPWMTLNAFTRGGGVEVSDADAADDDDSVEVAVVQPDASEVPPKSDETAPEEAAPVTETQVTPSESSAVMEAPTPIQAAVTSTSEENAKSRDDESIGAPDVVAPDVVKDTNEIQDEPQDKYAVNVDTDISDQGYDDVSIDDALRIAGDAIDTEPTAEPSVDEGIDVQDEIQQESSSQSFGIIDSALASFVTGVCVQNTGDIEVIAPMEDPTTENETASSFHDPSSLNDPSLAKTLESAETSEAGEDNALSVGASDGIIARRQAQLTALADSISVQQDGAASVELSVHSESSNARSSKGSFKAKLSHLLSKDSLSKEATGEDSDGAGSKHDLPSYKMEGGAPHDERELDKELNAFFDQLDDMTLKSDVSIKDTDGEVSAITFAESACFPNAQQVRSITPAALSEFDEQKFEEQVEKQVCGALPSAFREVNVQNATESKVAALVDDILSACGRRTDDKQDISVSPGSQEALSGNGDSVNGDFETLGEEDTMDPFKLLDFFDGQSLDDSFWSALDDSRMDDSVLSGSVGKFRGSTIEDESVRSGSVRMLRGLFRKKKEPERSLDSSFENESVRSGSVRRFREVLHEYKKGADDDGTEFNDSIFDTVVEEKSPESQGQDIQEKVDAALKSGTESSEKENVLPDDKPQEVCVPSDNDKLKENTPPASNEKASRKVDPKSRDKAIQDIEKAMAMLKKYAARHGVSEPELLWKIQEEHKKRKDWSPSMADF